ncbi:MAG: hypothetical protein PHQ12_10825 [Chthoniobacteraceae bacterium]|nr:hypothetical protein [Chthoniobacteraceae bacterium]
MAFHLNFYHEIHKQEERNRRDPVKLAWLGGLVLVICMALWYFYRLSEVSAVEARRNEVRRTWASLEPQGKDATGEEARLLALQKSNEELIARLHGRFYWAPFLEKLAAATPPFVQIVSLTGDLEAGRDKKQMVTVVVRGLSAGAQPRTAAEAYRRSLQESLGGIGTDISVVFDGNSLEDGAETVQFDGQALATASFRLRVQFTPKP